MPYFSKIYQTELPHRAKLVYLYLHDRQDKECKAWPGIKTIAADLSLSRSTVKRAIKDLEKATEKESELILQNIFNSKKCKLISCVANRNIAFQA